MNKIRSRRKPYWAIGCSTVVAISLSVDLCSQEDDYEFMPPEGWAGLSETGDDDASMTLAEGFEGLDSEPAKNTMIEPVDGSGGFDNVAPRLGAEEGPGGLEWDPSPTYRTRYKGSTNYAVGSGMRVQGNNWFMRIPYAMYVSYSDEWRVRFDANTFRVYKKDPYYTNVYWGQFGNKNSKLVKSGSGSGEQIAIYDTRGKTYVFTVIDNYKCSRIEGPGGEKITFSYSGGNIATIMQKDASGADVRRFTYTVTSNRLTQITIDRQVGFWANYRNIFFVYHENVTGAVEGSNGDLIGIQDERLLSPDATWLKQRWVFKYWTGSYGTNPPNPGSAYQVRAVLGPQGYREFLKDNPSASDTYVYTRSTSQLESYVARTYEYVIDKRIDKLALKGSCGCGGGEGLHIYAWNVSSPPSDLNTWSHWVKITLPDPDNGGSQVSPARIIDYNNYGQKLNSIEQEVASNSSSRRWIQTWRHDTTGRLTDLYSVSACPSTSYNDAYHMVTPSTSYGQWFTFTYDSNNASLTTVKLRDPSNGNLNLQVRKSFNLQTSGDARRFLNMIRRVFHNEITTDDTNFNNPDTGDYATTKFAYTYHPSRALAVRLRTTTTPVVTTGTNGSGSAVSLYGYFESDGRHSWSKDGDGFVHYMGIDANDRTLTKQVRNINTSNPPGVTVPTDSDFTTNFWTTSGLNLVESWAYDLVRRPMFHEGPQFNALHGGGIVATKTKQQWHYTRLFTGEPVTIEYPHLDSNYFHVALSLTVRDLEGNVLTAALGELTTQDTGFDNDFDESQSTLGAGFAGTIVRRTDFTYEGDKLEKGEVWSDALGTAKFTTTHFYDMAGRKEKTVNPVGTITRWTYDALGRMKTRDVGTDDSSPGNMTKVEERFYDDEETGDTDDPNSRGLLTQVKLFTNVAGEVRETNLGYDYRGRLSSRKEPEDVRVAFVYTNRNQVKETKTYKDSASTLFAQATNVYDSWGRVYEAQTWGVPGGGGTASGYASVWTWRNKRGLVIKTQSRGKVFEKTEYDGAGRVTRRAVSYDTAETSYADASNLNGDTVIQETRYILDAVGANELVRTYERRHNGTGTGELSVGTSGNARAQYAAAWYDKLHRMVHRANYGTYGGVDMTVRPAGSPPASSSPDSLVTKQSYTTKSEPYESTDTMGIVSRSEYDYPGRLSARIDRYVNGDPGPGTDEDRRVEYTYNAAGQVLTTTAKLSNWDDEDSIWYDRVTENAYGMTLTQNPALASNDLLRLIKYPDPDRHPILDVPGQPSEDANDQEAFAYNAQGEVISRENAMGTTHTLDYDLRGRLTSDLTNGSSQFKEITRTYDTLDRPVLVTARDDDGDAVNQIQYEYDKFSTVSKIWQDWDSAVDGTSPKVQFSYSFPTDGTTAVRKTSTTYPSGKAITEVYGQGTDNILNRVTSRYDGTTTFFQDSYLGLGRLVERQYGGQYVYRTLVGTDSANQDNYIGLDRFGRIDYLTVINTNQQILLNRYEYGYNYRSQVTLRKDLVGSAGGSNCFSETSDYDNLGRLIDHQRGVYSSGSMTTIHFHECWGYDRAGNVRSYYSGISSTCGTTITQEFNASNEIKKRNGDTSYAQWNDLGSLTRKGFATDSYTWDVWNRMTQAANYGTGSTLANYTYNGLGQVISRTNSFSTQPAIYYYYDESGQVLEEIKISGGTVHNWYVWGSQGDGDLVARAGPSVQYSIQDAGGNVVTRLDSSVAPFARYVYEGYGKPSQLTANWSTWQTIAEDLCLFSGELYEKDHAQYRMGNRIGDPDIWSFAERANNAGKTYFFPGTYIEGAKTPTVVTVCCNYCDGEGQVAMRVRVTSNRPETTCRNRSPEGMSFCGLSTPPCGSGGGTGGGHTIAGEAVSPGPGPGPVEPSQVQYRKRCGKKFFNPRTECCICKQNDDAKVVSRSEETEVKVCWRQAQLPGGGPAAALGMHHMWIETPYCAMGLGPVGGGADVEAGGSCPGTAFNDHKGESAKSGSDCLSVRANACCIHENMPLGQETGKRCGPTYNCNTVVYDTLSACGVDVAGVKSLKGGRDWSPKPFAPAPEF
jgi:YD repeat-containing protein